MQFGKVEQMQPSQPGFDMRLILLERLLRKEQSVTDALLSWPPWLSGPSATLPDLRSGAASGRQKGEPGAVAIRECHPGRPAPLSAHQHAQALSWSLCKILTMVI